MRTPRLLVDDFFRHVIQVVSMFSLVALVAIILFVFVQGAEPFFSSTAPSVRLVAQNIPKLEVNGVEYLDRTTFIPLEKGVKRVSIQFVNRGEPVSFTVDITPHEKDGRKALRFIGVDEEKISYQEAYTASATWPGLITGLEQSITILLPEDPYPVLSFLGGLEWRPTHLKLFGILPMILATILSTILAVAIGVPLALLSAVFIGEYLPRRIAGPVRAAIDLLAGIPSVVYGFFGLMVIVPLVQRLFNAPSGSSLASAVFILAVRVLPTIVAITITSIEAVPGSLREASLAVGASSLQTTWRVVVPAARSGILAGIILGVSRAIGETMAVILVAGNSPQLPTSLTDSIRTLTATIALEMGYAQGRHSQILFSIGIVLFVMILILNTVVLKLKERLTRGL